MKCFYDSSFSEIESLLQRHCPAIMATAAKLDGDAAVRTERRPKSRPGARTVWRVISPEIGEGILAMHAKGRGSTEMANHYSVNESTIRTFLKKRGLLPNNPRICKNMVKELERRQNALIAGSACGVPLVKTNHGKVK
jgi:hypothetical protein